MGVRSVSQRVPGSALAGGVALGYEVVWTQAIVQFLSTRAFAFAIVLATYLAGLFLGSLLGARSADRTSRPWLVFGCLITAAGGSAMLLFAVIVLPERLYQFQSSLIISIVPNER